MFRKRSTNDELKREGMLVARPMKLNDELINRLTQYIKVGNYIETACALVGISRSIVYVWLKQGRRAIETSEKTGEVVPRKDKIYVKLVMEIDQALAFSEARDVETIGEHAKSNWKAAAWRLERKFPTKWGRKDQLQANVNHSGEMKVEHNKMAMKIGCDEEMLDLAMKLFEKVQGGELQS